MSVMLDASYAAIAALLYTLVGTAIYFAWTRFLLTGGVPTGLPFRLSRMERAGLLAALIYAILAFLVGGVSGGLVLGITMLVPAMS